MAIKERTYYRLSLVLPLVVGVLWGLSGPGASDAGLLTLVVIFALVPYALFAVALAVWSLDRSAQTVRIALLLSPILFVPIAAVVAWPLAALIFGSGFLETIVALAPVSLFVGYACVGLSLALLLLLEVFGLVQRELSQTSNRAA